MKLGQIGMMLLGLPLVCQVIFGAVLVSDLNQLDAAARHEADAKQIIGCCEEVRSNVSKYSMMLAAARFESSENTQKRLQDLSALIEQRLRTLNALVKGDPEAEDDVRRYKTTLNRLLDLYADTSTKAMGLSGTPLARFLTEGDFLEELAADSKESLRCETSLISRYSPVVREFSPKAIRDREEVMALVIGGVLLNVVLVVGVAVFFGKVSLKRLDKLISNIASFSQGNAELEVIGGSDEISQLDREFRMMARARLESEHLKQSLYAMVSHDLKSPLTSMSLTLDMVLSQAKRLSLDEDTIKKLRRVIHEINRLAKLASSYLDLEQIEGGKLQMHKRIVNAADLLASSVEIISALADAKLVRIICTVEPQHEILCDPDRIVQVLVNILSNSIKYAPRNSDIELSMSMPSSKLARFEISDHGPGIAQPEREKLFKQFAHLHQAAGADTAGSGRMQPTSSGLGLYICKQLVGAHGGTIGANFPAEGGTTFWFELPMDDNFQVAEMPASAIENE